MTVAYNMRASRPTLSEPNEEWECKKDPFGSPTRTILTRRLQIDPFNHFDESHCNFLVRLWNTDDFIESCGKTPITTPEKARDFIWKRMMPKESNCGAAQGNLGFFVVSLFPSRDAPGNTVPVPVGIVSLIQGQPPDPHYTAPDVGFAILPEYSRKGYATEAVTALLGWARTEHCIQVVFGFCDPQNWRSRRVLEKVGMEARGVAQLQVFGGKKSDVYAIKGSHWDLSVYGITEKITKH
ncbi:hypothetical protein N7532_005958 [Penicillium argentinense]|uniref:N-acetyltransferase domain-containing protein n=1 Tax=Penicillium argentinense TaxID=1131581 RepID=A0A9W9KBH4_9EURO|nr:uncharacterized protein N7532_005958 [Penicillium argentinense]KAJ5098957.1 hypothetical protein N7532_005958 [Penicillium argentinense]